MSKQLPPLLQRAISDVRRRRLAHLALVFALAFALCGPMLGAIAGSAVVAAARQNPIPQASAPAAVDLRFVSPRATMATYLDAIAAYQHRGRTADLRAAAECFDLGDASPIERDLLGRLIAQKLINVLNKVERVDLAQVPGPDEVRDATTASVTLERADNHPFRIDVLFTRDSAGAWRVSSDTVRRVDEWWEQLAEVPALPGLEQEPTLQERVRATVPERFQRKLFLFEHWQWIGLAALVLAGMALQRVVSMIVRRFVDHIGREDSIKLDKHMLVKLGRPLALGFTSSVFLVCLPLLDLDNRSFLTLELSANFLFTFALVWTAYGVVDIVAWYLGQKALLTESKFDDMLVPLMRRTFKVVVVLVGVVFVITRIKSDLWGVVAGLSIGSLAVGFAAKESIENMFGTFTVLMDKPFQLGDLILMEGIEGTVEDVGFRSTRVRTPEDALITVPNRRFISAHVENRGLRRFRRTRTTLGITYDTPPELIEAFCEGVRELIRRHPYTRKDQYHVWFNAFDTSSLDILLQVFFEVPDWPTEQRERHRLYLDILRLADQLGVSFAFPTQTVNTPKEPDPDAAKSRPKNAVDAITRARAMAGEIATDSLKPFKGERPPPIRFTQDPNDAGHGALGEEASVASDTDAE